LQWKRIIGKPGRGFLYLILTAFLLFSLPAAYAEDQPETGDNSQSVRLVYVVPVHQKIETGLQKFLSRAFAEAESVHADYVVLDINTFGGRLDAAIEIGELIRMSEVRTVAFIHGKAVSAGSYIALNADRIVMEPGSTIGSASVVDIAGNEVEDPKIISHWVSEMKAAAQAGNRDPLIAEGMVDKNVVVPLPELNRTKEKGEILSLTAEEALVVGYADHVAGALNEVLSFIGAEEATVVTFDPTPAERLARFLTDPVVMTILLLLGIAGIAIELFVPGFGVPGIVGVASFALYFFGHYVAGFAGFEDIALFILGVALMIVEIFVPGFGIFGIAGIISLICGVVLAAYNTKQAFASLGIAFLIAVVVLAIVIKFFGYKGVWNRFILRDEQKSEEGYTPTAPKNHLLGKVGTSLTPLRPAGTIRIGDENVDVVSRGEFISAGSKVKVILVEGPRVVVSEIKEENTGTQ